MGHAFIWPGVGFGWATAQEPLPTSGWGCHLPIWQAMSHPFLPQLSGPPGEFLKLGGPVQDLLSLPELQPCPRLPAFCRWKPSSQACTPPLRRSSAAHGLDNSRGGKALSAGRCFLLPQSLQHRVWGFCQAGREGPEPRRLPGALR